VFPPEGEYFKIKIKLVLPGALEGNRCLAMHLMENGDEENAVVFFPNLAAYSLGSEITDEQFLGIDDDLLVIQYVIKTLRSMNMSRFIKTILLVEICFQFRDFKTEMIITFPDIVLYIVNALAEGSLIPGCVQVGTFGMDVKRFE